MFKKGLLPILLLLFGKSLKAQEEFVPPPSKLITQFNFRLLTGGIITFKAHLNNFSDTLNFILDTGSGGISLDSMTTIRLNLKTEMSDRTIRGIAGIRQVRFAYNNSLKIPGLKVDSLNFHINDYDVLTSSYGEKIDGIMGYAFLSRYIVKIDYDSSKIYVYSKGTFKYPRGGFLIKPILVNLPIVNTTVRDEKEILNRYYFDTGAGMCLLLSSDFVNDSLFVNTKKRWYATQAEGLGGKASMRQGVVKQIRIGPYKFKNVPTYIFEDEFNVTSYPYLGGLLGNDLLRRFNVILNYDRRDIYLIPNSHFHDPFDYSYTGLGMYVIDGEIRIVDVMPESPAMEAGFKPGDVVLAVENNFTSNIQAYKALLQTPGGKLKVLVLREDGPVLLTLKVKSIMN